MEELFGHILDHVSSNPWVQSLLVVTSTCFIEDAARCWVALLVADGHIGWWLAFFSMTVGGMAGDIGLYFMGRYATLFLLRRRWVDAARLTWMEGQFQRHACKAVFVSRYVPGARTLCYVSAGAVRYPLPRFLLVLLLAAASQALIFLKAVWFISAYILPYLKDRRLQFGVFAVIVAVLGWAHLRFLRKRREAERLLQPGAGGPAR